jgi:shikimate kinase
MAGRDQHPELTLNLALIGGRGSGKSSVAKRLARRNRNFMLFSLDPLIRYEAGGCSIPEIVERHGWAHFRELEYQVLAKLSEIPSGALLDCGGGIVVDLDANGEECLSERKLALLSRCARVVYLRRDPRYLEARIADDSSRPNLSAQHSFAEIMSRRDPWYREAADLVLECDPLSKNAITDQVLRWFYQQCGLPPELADEEPS